MTDLLQSAFDRYAARVEEIGREDAVDRPGERSVAGDQHAQPQLRRVEDVLQLHQLPR